MKSLNSYVILIYEEATEDQKKVIKEILDKRPKDIKQIKLADIKLDIVEDKDIKSLFDELIKGANNFASKSDDVEEYRPFYNNFVFTLYMYLEIFQIIIEFIKDDKEKIKKNVFNKILDSLNSFKDLTKWINDNPNTIVSIDLETFKKVNILRKKIREALSSENPNEALDKLKKDLDLTNLNLDNLNELIDNYKTSK